jgi:simple sugar transport system substrate-binding protein
MSIKRRCLLLSIMLVILFISHACDSSEPEEEMIFGMLLVGPYNDQGWSQAHFDGGLYVEEKLDNVKMLWIDKVNPADRPDTTTEELAQVLVQKGASLIIFTSDDMKDAAIKFARAHPQIIVIHAGGNGDTAWKEGKNYENIHNLGNVMGRMEFGRMISGCSAALTTQTGKIGYLGPLVNEETLRLAASTYLGAKYCWTDYLRKDPEDLTFKVTWIGFWFDVPGVTLDPSQVSADFFNSGYDVVISGIDTREALQEAKKFADAGNRVWAAPYDYIRGCEDAPEVCIGVSYFNWGPGYLRIVKAAQSGDWERSWDWESPDFTDINNRDTSAVGFIQGDGLTPNATARLDEFISALGKGLNLWIGPINLIDGTMYLSDGEVATDQQIWYLPRLLEGMIENGVRE